MRLEHYCFWCGLSCRPGPVLAIVLPGQVLAYEKTKNALKPGHQRVQALAASLSNQQNIVRHFAEVLRTHCSARGSRESFGETDAAGAADVLAKWFDPRVSRCFVQSDRGQLTVPGLKH